MADGTRQRGETDAEPRQRAATELDTSFLVEAGAGTGKTSVLLQRLLTVLRTGRSRLERIAAITFTEKAATELRLRLRTEIDAALSTQLSQAERDNLRAARLQLERASILTVHAFCALLLRERPLEARVNPNFSVLDGVGRRVIQDQTWRDWLAQEMESRPDSLKTALRAGLSLAHVRALRDFMVEQRDCLTLLPEPLASPLPQFRHTFRQAIERLSQLGFACSERSDRAFVQLMDLSQQLPDHDADPLWERLLYSPLDLSERLGNKTHWHPASSLDEVRSCFAQLRVAHRQARAAWVHNHTLGLVRWLGSYLAVYDDTKRQRTCLDFPDLLLSTRDLLANNLEARRYFQHKFDFLLVDEFQDTDPLQAEIVFFLAEHTPRARDWNQVVLKPGKLFLVGDPHQSIYRFRRADLDVYRLVRTIIEGQGKVLGLSSNFRTRAPILDWINDTFSRVFAPAAAEDGLRYRPLHPTRHEEPQDNPSDTLDSGPAVIPVPVPVALLSSRPRREDLRRVEAQTVADFLTRRLGEGDQTLSPGDIAVLFRTYRAMDAYEEAFQNAAIPYQILGGRQYMTRDEVEELRVLLRAIDSPADSTALVASLRSSLFGFSDEALAHFVGAGGVLQYTAGPLPDGPPDADRFAAAFALLRELHARSRQSSPSTLLYELYTRTHLVPLFALRPQGNQRTANLLKLIELAHSLADQGIYSLSAFNRFLSHHHQATEEGEAVIAEEHHPTVRFLTIHKAKGLEFPVVILADAVLAPSRPSRTGLIERGHTPTSLTHAEGESGRLSQPQGRLELRLGPHSLAWQTLGWQEVLSREGAREEAEERRLWYVAATRARDQLIVPALPELDGTTGQSLWRVFEDQITEPRPDSPGLQTDIPAADRPGLTPELTPGLTLPPILPDQSALARYQAWQAEQRAIRQHGKRPQTVSELSVESLIHGAHTAVPRSLGHAVRMALKQGAEPNLQVLNSPLLSRARAAQKCFAELPFSLHYQTPSHTGTVLNGVIDLAFLENGAWVIVGLKDDVLSDGQAEPRAARYRSELSVYALALEQLSVYPVQDLVVLFARSATDVHLAWNDRARADVQTLLDQTQPRP
ncbi:MAG: UvrD-helicase domain-containing protein [Desulfurellaceae bacterium]|nr:UvrD-helicase domain-containing protein [Desulfurellaceae bacterium]